MRRQRARGFIFVTALSVIVFLTLTGASLLVGGLTQANHGTRIYHRANALYLAEAALDQAAQNLRTSSTSDDVGVGSEVALSTGTFQIETQASLGNGLYQVVGHGTSQLEQRRLESYVRYTPQSVFQYALLGDNGIQLSGNMTTDSYDSRAGLYDNDPLSPTYNQSHNGDVATNSTADGALDLSGISLTIDGQLVVGPDVSDPTALVDGYDASLVTGGTDPPSDTQDVTSLPEEIELAPVVVPTGLTCSDLTIGASQVVTLSPTGGPLGNGTYCYHDLDIEGGATFTTTGPVSVYLTGTMQAVGDTTVGLLNDPTALVLYVADGGVATIEGTVAGSSNFYGAIYAPGATIAIGGEANIFGAVVAENIYVAGDAQIHYDEALADSTNGPTFGDTQQIAWREL